MVLQTRRVRVSFFVGWGLILRRNQWSPTQHLKEMDSSVAIPEGWIDDMTVAIPPGRTVDELVAMVMEGLMARKDPGAMLQALEKDQSPILHTCVSHGL